MDIRSLDLNLLLILDGLFEERSVSSVAKRLRVSQPTISASLRRLRVFFGDEMFIRTGRGMRPTSYAEGLAGPVRLIIETIQNELLHKPEFDPRQSNRCFKISTSDLGELVFLPEILRIIRSEAPSTSIRCVGLAHNDLEGAMEEGTIDLAIGYFPDLDGPAINCQKLFDHPFACIVREGHPDIGDEISLEQFLSADHLVVNQEGRSQEIFEHRLRELGLKRRILVELPHFMSVPQLIANSEMISTVPRAVGASYAHHNRLRFLVPPLEIPPISIKQYWHRRAHNDAALIWLRTQLARRLMNRDPAQAPGSPIFPDIQGLAE